MEAEGSLGVCHTSVSNTDCAEVHVTIPCASRDLRPVANKGRMTGERKAANEAAAAQYRDSLARIQALHPSQQDVLLQLKDYGSLVAWSQVTPAAHEEESPREKNQPEQPWNSLSNLLSPEALLATSKSPCSAFLPTAASHFRQAPVLQRTRPDKELPHLHSLLPAADEHTR